MIHYSIGRLVGVDSPANCKERFLTTLKEHAYLAGTEGIRYRYIHTSSGTWYMYRYRYRYRYRYMVQVQVHSYRFRFRFRYMVRYIVRYTEINRSSDRNFRVTTQPKCLISLLVRPPLDI